METKLINRFLNENLCHKKMDEKTLPDLSKNPDLLYKTTTGYPDDQLVIEGPYFPVFNAVDEAHESSFNNQDIRELQELLDKELYEDDDYAVLYCRIRLLNSDPAEKNAKKPIFWFAMLYHATTPTRRQILYSETDPKNVYLVNLIAEVFWVTNVTYVAADSPNQRLAWYSLYFHILLNLIAEQVKSSDSSSKIPVESLNKDGLARRNEEGKQVSVMLSHIMDVLDNKTAAQRRQIIHNWFCKFV